MVECFVGFGCDWGEDGGCELGGVHVDWFDVLGFDVVELVDYDVVWYEEVLDCFVGE